MRTLLFLVSVLVSNLCASQPQSIQVNQNFNGAAFQEFAAQMERISGVRFFYDPEWTSTLKIIQPAIPSTLHQILKETLSSIRLDYVILHNKFIVLVNEERIANDRENNNTTLSYQVTGTIINPQTGSPVRDAVISIPGLKKEIPANDQGSFTARIPSGHHYAFVDAPGFAQMPKLIRVFSDVTLEIELYEKMIELEEVEISDSQMQGMRRLELGAQQLSTESLRAIPPLLGEKDLVRSILSLPGVKTVGEGASGFNVRGGNVDQNLILIDNAPLYNSSHLFGLFSVVDSDIVKSMSIHKGIMPVRYGGRLSSVLDVEFIDKVDDKELRMEGSVGFISSKLKASIPLIQNRTSAALGFRGAYPNWILRMVPDPDVRQSRANFYDATAKMSHRINSKSFVTATLHMSHDAFRLGRDTTYSWSGLASSVRWMHSLAPGLNAKLSVFHSGSINKTNSEHAITGFELTSSIKSSGLSYDLSFELPSGHMFDVGVQSGYIQTRRGDLKSTGQGSSSLITEIPGEHGVESAVYLSDDFAMTPHISLSAGIRLSNFLSLGSGNRYYYESGSPRNEHSETGSEYISRSTVERSFVNIEPRAAVTLAVSDASSIKGGYSRNFQYLSLLSNTTAVSPMDTWKLSDVYLGPQRSDQVSLGYFRNFLSGVVDASVEVYYRRFSNITQYKEGARLILNERIETDLLQGIGKAYGVELYVKKNSGKFKGWVSYTYSRSFVKVAGNADEETLSNGTYFPSNFDKPHDLGVVSSYTLSGRVTVSANFVYSTGRPVTYPESIYVLDGFVVANYSSINQARIPDYHRLDIAVNHTMLQKRNRRFETSWSLGVYNAYARRNPFSIFFRPEYSGRYPQAYRLSVLGTIIPYFTLNFKIK